MSAMAVSQWPTPSYQVLQHSISSRIVVLLAPAKLLSSPPASITCHACAGLIQSCDSHGSSCSCRPVGNSPPRTSMQKPLTQNSGTVYTTCTPGAAVGTAGCARGSRHIDNAWQHIRVLCNAQYTRLLASQHTAAKHYADHNAASIKSAMLCS